MEKDDVVLGLMMKVCGLTADAEKAIKFFNEINELPEVRIHTLHYSNLIDTLSKRRDYAERALEYYDLMVYKKIQPDYLTF